MAFKSGTFLADSPPDGDTDSVGNLALQCESENLILGRSLNQWLNTSVSGTDKINITVTSA